ncbi:glycoside hydrolase family 3 N-terminal domain-containing protein [Pseudoalteromonas piscicida]|uniref:beta-N-acetylhexosaminidase n=1 Tax=Pseudoalteromonas piscicida TaxID=43662 RepID=A0ABM6NKV4_PSEO7|nr:glycoside hydrolase family 3 N-terminal domain-containing protein [Pseudoalteromonas piscicida]ATD09467.1 beta-N-acetylhexosaminidase [Pseudoalteromonas piscicida]WPU31400.1 glycoside hydrolase family 3 N-terminal domain-containing protein [Pseudoalteromonas piscicida]
MSFITSAHATAAQVPLTTSQMLGQKLMLDFRYYCGESKKPSGDCRAAMTTLPPELSELISKYDIGGAILFAENVQNTAQIVSLTNALQSAAQQSKSQLPLFIAIDQEGGRVARINREQATSFTGNMIIGATYPKQGDIYATKVASAIGKELNILGINVNFAPTVDVNSNPNNPVINVRSFSENPEVVAKLGLAQVKAFEAAGVLSALKHFPGHGDTHVDSHTGLPRVDHDRDKINQQDLLPFAEIIKASPPGMIMTAHIQYPALDNSRVVNSQGESMIRPATMSSQIMTQLLRHELGYQGVTVTDALDMAGISDFFNPVDATIETFNAGVDIALMPIAIRNRADIKRFEQYMAQLADALETNKLNQEQLSSSMARIAKIKSKLPQSSASLAIANSTLGNPSHRRLEAELALAAITEVKNDGVLPLRDNAQVVQLIMPDRQKCFALEQALQTYSKNSLTLSCTSLQAYDPDIAHDAIKQADVIIAAHASPPQSAVEIGGMDDVKKLREHGVARNVQPEALKALLQYGQQQGKKQLFISLRAPYEISTFGPLSNAVLASYAYNVDVNHDKKVAGPAYTALAKVILGIAKAEGSLPVTVNH